MISENVRKLVWQAENTAFQLLPGDANYCQQKLKMKCVDIIAKVFTCTGLFFWNAYWINKLTSNGDYSFLKISHVLVKNYFCIAIMTIVVKLSV